MLVVLLLASAVLRNVQCLKIAPVVQLYDSDPLLLCIANVTRQYFVGHKNKVYLKSNSDDQLKFLHSMKTVSFKRKGHHADIDLVNPVLTYMIFVRDVNEFLPYMSVLAVEGGWNPYAHFLVIIDSVETEDLRQVFDSFLQHRVYNVVVLNGTDTTELYTYNPFENFACGRYYTRIIYYGKCPDVAADIYPNKVITGLRNCFFNVAVAHWPPYGVDPSKLKYVTWDEVLYIGIEQYVFHLISEIEQFKYKSDYDFEAESFSTISRNLTISGPLARLIQNKSDFLLGGMFLISTRVKWFSYISGYLDYIDEIRIMVKKAELTPAWMDIYLEFSPMVWILILFTLVLYSLLVIILMKAKDKGHVVLMLLDHLLSHGSRLHSRQSVKCVLITWIIFAYFVNSFYTTTLMSLTTKPSTSYQIRDEQTAISRGLEPCISSIIGTYLKTESNHGEILADAEYGKAGCEKLLKAINTTSKSNRLFTITIYSIYYIYRKQFCDVYGNSMVYSFTKPYTKLIYAMYYNNGFPMRERLYKLALKIREAGLSDKSLKDHYYAKTLKYHFRSRGFVARFAIPWYLYGLGVLISTFAFVVELVSKHNKIVNYLNK